MRTQDGSAAVRPGARAGVRCAPTLSLRAGGRPARPSTPPPMPPVDLTTVQQLAVATLLGLAVGIEREWSGHATGPTPRFAGTRTFLLLGLVSGIAGWLLVGGQAPLALTLLGACMALILAAYLVTARAGGDAVEATTEVAGLTVIGLAALAGAGEVRLASGAAALVVLVLAEKGTVRRLVPRIGEQEMRAAMHFAVLALVVLPLLPDRSFGPLGGIRPRSLWIVVLLLSGLDFAGYVARRIVGPARGYGLAGLLGGLVSSTAVTLNFSRRSRDEPALSGPLALGVVGACTVLLPRVLLVSVAVAPAVATRLLPLVAAPLVAGVLMTGWGLLRQKATTASDTDGLRNPLRLGAAIQMALLFQAVLMAVEFVRMTWGATGLLASGALLGLTDTDALTLAMSRMGREGGAAGLAAAVICVGILSNTVVKLGLSLALGGPRFRRLAGAGLAVLLLATAVSLAVAWRAIVHAW